MRARRAIPCPRPSRRPSLRTALGFAVALVLIPSLLPAQPPYPPVLEAATEHAYKTVEAADGAVDLRVWLFGEAAGASKIGSIFIYFLVASIGMKMDIKAIASNPCAAKVWA